MGRAPCCSKVGLSRGSWTVREDTLLINYIQAHGEGRWSSMCKKAGTQTGLLRCGKSCRLRWMNYLRPDIKRGNITPDEDDLIIRLHSLLGNRWSLIAKRLPGRTDNEIKNYWKTHLSKRVQKRVTNSNTSEEPASRSSRNNKPMKTTEKKQKNNGATPTVTTTKVHQPKACRVSPFSVITRSSSFDNMTSGSSSGGEGSKGANNDTQVFYFTPHWSDIDAAAATNQEFPYGFDATAFLDAAPVWDNHNTNMLDDIFEEYQQLLEGDDPGEGDYFFDSVFI